MGFKALPAPGKTQASSALACACSLDGFRSQAGRSRYCLAHTQGTHERPASCSCRTRAAVQPQNGGCRVTPVPGQGPQCCSKNRFKPRHVGFGRSPW